MTRLSAEARSAAPLTQGWEVDGCQDFENTCSKMLSFGTTEVVKEKEKRGVVWPKRKGIYKTSTDACIEFLCRIEFLTLGVMKGGQ